MGNLQQAVEIEVGLAQHSQFVEGVFYPLGVGHMRSEPPFNPFR